MAEEKQLPPEENIENYEEFDVVDDLYMPIYDEEENTLVLSWLKCVSKI